MAEQIQNLEQAEKILDYWYAIDFFGRINSMICGKSAVNF
ncbi:hypothetical protein CE91St58_04300 [Lachnospiraceae bacterium]|nr:hypothetical protein CE91St58_04300 [Lachnospiraceae bacterium]